MTMKGEYFELIQHMEGATAAQLKTQKKASTAAPESGKIFFCEEEHFVFERHSQWQCDFYELMKKFLTLYFMIVFCVRLFL